MKNILAVIMLIISLMFNSMYAPDKKSDNTGETKETAAESMRKQMAEQQEAKQSKEEQTKVTHASEQEPAKIMDELFKCLEAARADYERDSFKEGSETLKHATDTLVSLNSEEIKKVLAAAHLTLQQRFDLLYALADFDAFLQIYSRNAPSAHIKTVIATLMNELMDSLTSQELAALFTQQSNDLKSNKQRLRKLGTYLMRIAEAPQNSNDVAVSPGEKLFMSMIDVTKKLVEVLNNSHQEPQTTATATLLLNWVRQIPMTPVSEKKLHDALKGITVTTLPLDCGALKDWFLLFKSSKDQAPLVRALIRRYLQAVYKEGTIQAFRDAITITSATIPTAEIIKLIHTALLTAAQEKALQTIRDEDLDWVINTLKAYTEQQGPNIDEVWIALDKQVTSTIDSLKKTARTESQFNRLKQLQSIKQQMNEMLFEPSWTSKLSANVFSKIAHADKEYEPNLKSWNDKNIARYVVKTDTATYRDKVFTTPESLFDSICSYGKTLRWYGDFSGMRPVLFDIAHKYYAPKTFDVVSAQHNFCSQLTALLNHADAETCMLFMNTLTILESEKLISKKVLAAIEVEFFESIFNHKEDDEYESLVHKLPPQLLESIAASGRFTNDPKTKQFLNSLNTTQFAAFTEGIKQLRKSAHTA